MYIHINSANTNKVNYNEFTFYKELGCYILKLLNKLALIIIIIGAINWFSIGIFQYDIVASLFGGQSAMFSRVIYSIVGIAGIWAISLLCNHSSNLTAD